MRSAGPRARGPPVSRSGPIRDLVAELDRAETTPAAWALPLVPSWFGEIWASPDWQTRRGRLVLVPGELAGRHAAAAGLVVLDRPRLRG